MDHCIYSWCLHSKTLYQSTRLKLIVIKNKRNERMNVLRTSQEWNRLSITSRTPRKSLIHRLLSGRPRYSTLARPAATGICVGCTLDAQLQEDQRLNLPIPNKETENIYVIWFAAQRGIRKKGHKNRRRKYIFDWFLLKNSMLLCSTTYVSFMHAHADDTEYLRKRASWNCLPNQ